MRELLMRLKWEKCYIGDAKLLQIIFGSTAAGSVSNHQKPDLRNSFKEFCRIEYCLESLREAHVASEKHHKLIGNIVFLAKRIVFMLRRNEFAIYKIWNNRDLRFGHTFREQVLPESVRDNRNSRGMAINIILHLLKTPNGFFVLQKTGSHCYVWPNVLNVIDKWSTAKPPKQVCYNSIAQRWRR